MFETCRPHFFLSGGFAAENKGNVSAGFKTIDYKNREDGSEYWLLIEKNINRIWTTGLNWNHIKKYGQNEKEFGVKNKFIPKNNFSVEHGVSYSPDGNILPKIKTNVEFNYGIYSGYTINTNLNLKNYTTVDIYTLSVGVDVESIKNAVIVLRSYFTQSNFKQGGKNPHTGSFLFRPTYMFNEKFASSLFYSAGKESSIIGYPAQVSTLTFESYGIGLSTKVYKGVKLKIDLSRLKYSKIENESNEYILSLESGW